MKRAIVSCLFGLTVAAPCVRADEIVLPPFEGNAGSCAPFGCGTRIQTVFDAELFPSAFRIDALTFFNTTDQGAEGFAEPAQYRFSLSTTAKSSATIGSNLAANVGADAKPVAEFTITDFGTFFTTKTVELSTPFVFSPFNGNLLLDITKNQTGNFGDGPIFVNVNTSARGVATVIDDLGPNPLGGTSGGVLARNQAFNVGFSGDFFGPSFAPTPEPASLLLVGTGFAALVARRRRRADG
jgi:hypothetical protein